MIPANDEIRESMIPADYVIRKGQQLRQVM